VQAAVRDMLRSGDFVYTYLMRQLQYQPHAVSWAWSDTASKRGTGVVVLDM